MRMYDVIVKKRNGGELSEQEIRELVRGYTEGSIPDYQMAAFLMAVYFRGMTDPETAILTDAMAHSGDMVDLSAIDGTKVDKHSTGGVGDKTTLVVTPIVAACGLRVAKMSGRGLGHTGGTVDKLESIPGMCVALSEQEFVEQVNRIGIAVTGQSANLAPADKKIYALRDVTGTVESIPLIASSIMSKKLAAGSDCILLDVKVGSGAFMKTVEDAVTLAEKMVAIGVHNGRKTAALITNMDIPLGKRIGNALEVQEAVEVLQGKGPADLRHECLELAANLLGLAGAGSQGECRTMAEQAIASGAALERLADMVRAQGGDAECIYHPKQLGEAAFEKEIKAGRSGWIGKMDAEQIGISAMMLGAGRETKESQLDYLAGIIIEKKTGDPVCEGDVIARLRAGDERRFEQAEQKYQQAVVITDQRPDQEPLIYARVAEQVERF